MESSSPPLSSCNNIPSEVIPDESTSSPPLGTKSLHLVDGTTVSFVCLAPSSSSSASTAAVVHFGPLSACSASTLAWADFWAAHETTASLITVDRPGCHETSPVQTHDGADSDEDWTLKRMRINTKNILSVLQAEGIDTVYILAVCLGHAYAMDFARTLLQEQQQQRIKLCDISLVAPFVSTECPHTWTLARVGNAVPSFLLTGATDLAMAISSTLTPWFLGPSAIKNMLSVDEQAEWRDPEDYEHACQIVSTTAPMVKNVRATEARFGSSAVWQQVIDEFAKEAGYGLHDGSDAAPVLADGPKMFPRIQIHASPNDGMVTVPAVQWLAQRCYADCEVVLHKEASSHLPMTLFCGPPRNPLLLRHICQHEFGVLKFQE